LIRGSKTARVGSERRANQGDAESVNASFPGFQQKLVWFAALREWLDAV
jgi:hypothetical protein